MGLLFDFFLSKCSLSIVPSAHRRRRCNGDFAWGAVALLEEADGSKVIRVIGEAACSKVETTVSVVTVVEPVTVLDSCIFFRCAPKSSKSLSSRR